MRQFAGFGSARDTNERFKYLLAQGTDGLSTAFDMPTLMGYDADSERALGEVGREGVAVSTLADMETLFDGIRLDRVTTSMTVNCSASVLLAMYLVVAERQGCSWQRSRRDHSERHVQGVHRAEGVDLSACAVAPHRHRHDRVLHARGAALAPGVDLRLPHPRGRLDGGAGAGLHARRRHRLRGGGGRARARPRRVRAAALVLLQRPQRLLRRDRQDPSGPSHVGAHHARALRRQDRPRLSAAHPLPDLGRLAHRAAAAEQRRARRDAGAGRRAGRHAVAAHELARRDAWRCPPRKP